MASDHNDTLYLQRAKSELDLATTIFRLSNDPALKLTFELKQDATFYSNAIATSYYAIFYATKAYLAKNGIKTAPPEEHKKTYDAFETLVRSGTIDVALLTIYKTLAIRADTLLGIFAQEKSKRGTYTYKTLPQANREPAEDSVKNATSFLKHITLLLTHKPLIEDTQLIKTIERSERQIAEGNYLVADTSQSDEDIDNLLTGNTQRRGRTKSR